MIIVHNGIVLSNGIRMVKCIPQVELYFMLPIGTVNVI